MQLHARHADNGAISSSGILTTIYLDEVHGSESGAESGMWPERGPVRWG